MPGTVDSVVLNKKWINPTDVRIKLLSAVARGWLPLAAFIKLLTELGWHHHSTSVEGAFYIFRKLGVKMSIQIETIDKAHQRVFVQDALDALNIA